MNDVEPLAERARRREERRVRSRGRLRAVPLGSGPLRRTHIEPDAPRAIEEWDGAQWLTVGVAPNLAAAKATDFLGVPASDCRATRSAPIRNTTSRNCTPVTTDMLSAVDQFQRLVRWVGDGKPLTANGNIRL